MGRFVMANNLRYGANLLDGYLQNASVLFADSSDIP